jgi:hypothetical protein
MNNNGSVSKKTFTADDVRKIVTDAKNEIIADSLKHKERFAAYAENDASSRIGQIIAQANTQTNALLEEIRADGAEARRAIGGSDKEPGNNQSNQLEVLERRSRTTTAEVFLAIIAAVSGALFFWKIATDMTDVFFIKITFGALGAILCSAVVFLLSTVARSLMNPINKKESQTGKPEETGMTRRIKSILAIFLQVLNCILTLLLIWQAFSDLLLRK